MLRIRHRRIRRSRIERILYAVQHGSKYAAAPALGMMLGCIPNMRPLSVSPDGRYAAVPYMDEDQTAGGPLVAVIDLKTSAIRLVRQSPENHWWYSNTQDMVVSFNPDAEQPFVRVMSGDEVRTINNAIFPSLSRDGRFIVYSAAGEKTDDLISHAYGNLHVYDMKSGESKDLLTAGVFADFSPDGRHILFAARQTLGDNNTWKLCTIDREGGNRKVLSDIDPETAKLFCPRWLDDQTIVFRSRTDKSPNDGELFTITLDGQRRQITDTDVDDINPQVISPDRFVYARTRLAANGLEAETPADLYLAERKDGQWSHRALGIQACFFVATGDDIVYADQDGRVFRAPLSQPTQATSVNDLIARKAQGN